MKSTQDQPSEIDELKQKYGRVTTFEIPLDENEDDETPNRKIATVHLRNPDKKTRDAIGVFMGKGKYDVAILAGLKSLRIGGDTIESFENNDYAMISAEEAFVKHLQVAKTIIKKN